MVVLGGLVYFVGGQVLVETAIKIAVAVGISAGLFIVANKLFDLAYPRWALFAGLAGAGIGFIAFVLLDGNRALRELPARPWLWGLIGAVALGAAGLVLNAPSTIAWKLPMSVVTFAALGVLIGVAMNDSVPPELDWAQVRAPDCHRRRRRRRLAGVARQGRRQTAATCGADGRGRSGRCWAAGAVPTSATATRPRRSWRRWCR